MPHRFKILVTALAAALTLSIPLIAGCNNQRAHSQEGQHTIAAQSAENASASSYENPLWPTTNAELLNTPENQRWYNAWNSVDSYCTISGPVVDVCHTPTIAGETIFISIGEPYPSENSVELPIWTPDDQERFAAMISDFEEKPNCWITVTGYLTTYSGHLQFDANSGVDCEWKSEVE